MSAPSYKSADEIHALLKTRILRADSSSEVMDLWGQIPTWATDEGPSARAFWNIRRTGVNPAWPEDAIRDFQGPAVHESSSWEFTVRYPWTLDEEHSGASASEPTFERMVDAVLAEFANTLNLDGGVWVASLPEYDTGGTGFVMLLGGQGQALCHYGNFKIEIEQVYTRA